jgi:uncharacterized repeat protein (TIGR01451 family)
MKRFILYRFVLVCSLCVVLSSARAQYVAIPDTSFGNFLSYYAYSSSSCMIGNSTIGYQLDTACAAILPDSSFACCCLNLNNLTGIQYFKRLKYLDVRLNTITIIPALPDSLILLDVVDNRLTSLPALPAGLTELLCADNQLTELPELPPILNSLVCTNNKLTLLPNFPNSLLDIECNRNPGITCLPHIYASTLSAFFIDSTNINCMPNHFTAVNYDLRPDSFPICNPGIGCEFYYNISGNVHIDTATTCISDSVNLGPSISYMKVQLKRAGIVLQQFYTTSSGNYTFKADSLSSFDVSIDTSLLAFPITCPVGDIRNVTLSSFDSIEMNENFGMECPTENQFGAISIAGNFRPTYIHPVDIIAGNLMLLNYGLNCQTTATLGTVTTTFTGPAQYIGLVTGALPPTSVSSNTLSYNSVDLNSLTSNSLNIMMYVDSNAKIGDLVCFTVSIAPSGMTPDTLTECFVVQNSNDPNLKEVYPIGNIDTGAAQWLTYTIYFQNTGNDTAFTVIVKDTLSPNVDASTFQYLSSSNKAVIQLFGSACVFTFPKINLPDSAENPTGSVGWIQYKAKTKPNLPINTQIKNTAYIYFDANSAVVTNTTVNTVDTPTTSLGFRQITASGVMHLYPNPNKGSFALSTSNSIGANYTISDMLGNVIAQQPIKADNQVIEMPDAIEGVYTLTVRGAQPVRFVIVR